MTIDVIVTPPAPVDVEVETPGPAGAEGPQALPAFNLSGDLVASTSDCLPVVDDITLQKALFALTTPGTTETVVNLRKNGVVATTATIPADTSVYPFTIPGGLPLAADADVLQVEIVTAGTGAGGMTVVLA